MTFNDMCGFIHNTLISLGYRYIMHNVRLSYHINGYFHFIISPDEILYRNNDKERWYNFKCNTNGNFNESDCVKIEHMAQQFVKDYKQTKVDSRKKEIEKDFHND